MKLLKIKKNRAFVILFAVTISAILLSIALGVTNITFREIKFGTSAKNSNDAFFAADAGIECAMVYDKFVGGVFISPSSPSITCNNNNPIAVTENPPLYWSFIISGLGNGGQGCAKVTVDKTITLPEPRTTVTSRGYNNGGGVGTCLPGSNSVERQVELRY